ncbi:MAG: hypothetical protein L6R39_007211, partial [Caloplaca ligustica]
MDNGLYLCDSAMDSDLDMQQFRTSGLYDPTTPLASLPHQPQGPYPEVPAPVSSSFPPANNDDNLVDGEDLEALNASFEQFKATLQAPGPLPPPPAANNNLTLDIPLFE